MPDISFASVNPLSGIGGGILGLGSMGTILLVIAISVVIIGLIAGIVYWYFVKKAYWIKIHVFRLIGNIPTRTAIYSAKEVPFGMAGDKLWRVASSGMWKIRAIKWLPVGKIQSAPREFWYYIRDDQEWINFQMSDLNEISKKAGARFVQEDMRLQRLATERLLEQRLLQKSFWEQYGAMVMTIILFLVMAVCMVIMFYQFSKFLDKTGEVQSVQLETSRILYATFGDRYQLVNGTISSGGTGLIPVS
jgi:hypothetical protein